MAIGIVGSNNGYSRTASDNRFLKLSGGTVNGNLAINSGNISTSQPLTLTQTWNNEAGSFTSFLVNVTDTASGAAGSNKLLDLVRNGITVLDVIKSGQMRLAGTFTSAGFLNTGSTFLRSSAPAINFGASDQTSLRMEADHVFAFRGTTNPQQLRIYGTYSGSADHERLSLKYNVTDAAFQIGTEKGSVGGSARPLQFQTDGTTRMTITSGGNVGIGTTSPDASVILTINDSSQAQKAVNFDIRNGNFGWWRITSTNTNNPGKLSFNSNNSSATPLVLDGTSGGIVGIGITTPTAKLDILDTTLAGSGSLSGSALNIDQTWNTTGTPTAIKLNVTDTASNAASLLMDLRVGGVSKAKIGKNGSFELGQYNTAGDFGLRWDAAGNLNLSRSTGGTVMITLNTGANAITVGTVLARSFKNNVNTHGLEFGIQHVVEQRGGLNSQESRIYGTYTDDSNYRRLALKMSSAGVATVAAEGLGSGVSSNSLQFQTDGTTRLSIAAHAFTNSGLVVTSTGNNSTTLGFGAGTGANITRNTSGGFIFSDSAGSGAMIISTRGIQISGGNLSLQFSTLNGGAASLATSTGGGSPTRHNIHNVGALAHTTLRVQGGTSVGRSYFDTAPPTDGMLVQGNVGIGTTSPASKLTVTGGDIEVTDSASGIILKSPDGTRWRIIIDDSGELTTTAL
jgi:hypothetical protein